MSGKTTIAWAPQKGPQQALIKCPVYEIFYGGARGGGKTDGVIGKYGLKALKYGNLFNGVVFRREMPQADDLWERAKDVYTKLGATCREYDRTVRFPGGGRLRLRPLENLQAAEKYQGQNLSDACIEEAGNFPDPAPIMRIHAALRSGGGIPTQMVLTGNPGGPGQQWVKERYIDPHPGGYKIIREEFNLRGQQFSRSRVFIPAKVWDNKLLLENDPQYIANLHLVGSDQLVKAWLDGDWSAVEGAFFDKWSHANVIRPFQVPDYWLKFRSFDWGFARPFSVGWWAVADGSPIQEQGAVLPKGALIRYREWYGKERANVGLRLTAEEVADGILDREDRDERIRYSVADPAIFSEDGGPSIAERMRLRKVMWERADNRRVTRNGAVGGWDMMRHRIQGEDGVPMVYCFDTCADSIRTIPAMQHDQKNAEDMDTEGEDHAADEWRYACMSRPWVPKPKPSQRPITDQPTLNELLKMNDRHHDRRVRI